MIELRNGKHYSLSRLKIEYNINFQKLEMPSFYTYLETTKGLAIT